MIKVLNIISDTNIGGAGRCVLNFLDHFDRSKFEVAVAMPRGSLLLPEVQKRNIRAIEVDGIADKSLDLGAVSKLMAVIRAENPDVVHTHGAFAGRMAGRFCGKKVVYTRHSVFPVSPKIQKGPGRWLNKTANEFFSDDIIAVAEAAKENLTDGGVDPRKVRVILNGVEAVRPCTPEEVAANRQRYGVAEDEFVIGILARLEAVKGHDILIRAADQLLKEGRKIKVLIAGVGNQEEAIRQQIAELHRENEIRLLGFVSDVRSLLSVLSVQANASWGTEATSLALLEGMSLGIPAVASDYGGNPGVVFPGKNGYLFRQKDAEDMARYLRRLMDDPAEYARLQEGSREVFAQTFTAEQYARNIEAVYEGLVRKV